VQGTKPSLLLRPALFDKGTEKIDARLFSFRVMLHGFGKQVFSAWLWFIEVADVVRIRTVPM
jgi:hypothetical protein